MAEKKPKKKQENPAPEAVEEVAEVAEDITPEPVAEAEVLPPEPTAEELLAEEHDKFLRLAAEYDNFRKRSQKEREALSAAIKADTVTRLLPVYDNLSRALETPCTDESYFKGIEMTMTQLSEIFAGLGIEPIIAIGEQFDPERHNAVAQASVEGVESGTITMEFQKGFTMDGRVIRHSIVQVNS